MVYVIIININTINNSFEHKTGKIFTHPAVGETWSNISIHWESFLCPPDICKSNIYSSFSSVFGRNHLLSEITGF